MTVPRVPLPNEYYLLHRHITVKATHPWAGIPKRATDKSFGYDLQTLQEEVFEPGEVRVVPTGLALTNDLPIRPNESDHYLMSDPWDLPGQEGVAMLVLPRSSLPLKRGLMVANSPGLIDADYTGDIGIVLYNFRSTTVKLELGERVAQLVFVKLLLPQVVESAVYSNRAERLGFGSTG